MSGHVDLAERELVVILVIENVHEIRVEGMDLVQLGELGEHACQAIVVALLCIFDLARVELADASNAVLLVDDSWRLTLRLGQSNIDKVLV